MWKPFLTVLCLAGLTAAENVQCSVEFTLQHGSVFAIPGLCDKYLACVRGILAEFTCPLGAVFDEDLRKCSSDPQAKCSEENWTFANDLCSNLDEASAIPDPHSCTRYALCLGEFVIVRQCDHGLLFNSLIGICDTAQNVECDVTCPAEGEEVAYLPDSTGQSCARYYICENGIPQPAECSSMQYFDLVTESCTHPALASCRIQDVTCSEEGEIIANPESCTSFYRCEEGFPHYMECDAEHYFFDGQCIPGDCDDLITDETDGTTEVGTTSEPVTQSTIGTPTERPSTITTEASSTITPELPSTTPELTTELTTETQSTIATPTDSPSTVTTESPLTTPEITTVLSTEASSTVTTELSSMTPEFTTELSTIATPTDSPSTITTGLPPTTPTTMPTPTDSPSTVTTESPVTTPEITTVLSTEASSTVTAELPSTTAEQTTASQSTNPTPTMEPPATTPENTTPTHDPSTVTTGLPSTPSELTTASTQTAEPSTVTGEATTETPSTDPAVVCQGVDIGLFAHPFNCYQYFVCIFDVGRLFTCGNGQIFDPLLVCVAGNRETCVRSRVIV